MGEVFVEWKDKVGKREDEILLWKEEMGDEYGVDRIDCNRVFLVVGVEELWGNWKVGGELGSLL